MVDNISSSSNESEDESYIVETASNVVNLDDNASFFALLDRVKNGKAVNKLPNNYTKYIQWEQTDNIYNADHFTKIQFITLQKENRPLEHFCTGSTYEGEWDRIGMNGKGVYTMPHGCRYEGEMFDGMFHGHGTIYYPMGQKLIGIWENGQLKSFEYMFSDGLKYKEPWDYCVMPDRRFSRGIREGLRAPGIELLSNEPETRKIDEGCYDTLEGFFNATTKQLYRLKCGKERKGYVEIPHDIDEKGLEELLESDVIYLQVPTKDEEKYIKEHYRKAWDEPQGYKPHLNEIWFYGTEYDIMDELLEEKSLESQLREKNLLELKQKHLAERNKQKTSAK